MEAQITKREHTGKIRQNRKEKSYWGGLSLVVWNGVEIEGVATLRYYGSGQRVYACIWVNDSRTGTHTSGGGNAGGYGYHKASAAAAEAFVDAGITLNSDISGAGSQSVIEALQATGRALGYSDMKVIESQA